MSNKNSGKSRKPRKRKKTNTKGSKKKSNNKAEEKQVPIKLPSLQELLEAGSHFGHKTSRWNPAMEKYIFDTRAGIHIIDLAQTMELLYNAIEALRKASKKGNILLVGTKGQAATLIKRTGVDHGAFYISKRWPGGLMTNFRNVRRSVDKLMQLEEDLASRRGYKTKKERLLMEREKDSLAGLYEGIRFMRDMPAAMVVIDTRVEKNAIREARRLGVPTVGIIDTNCDPNLVDFPVPTNDDAIKSIQLFVNSLIQGFSNSKTSAKLIRKRNNYIDRMNGVRKKAKAEEERRKREKEREMQRLKAMKEGKEEVAEDDKSPVKGKVVRVKKKQEEEAKPDAEKSKKESKPKKAVKRVKAKAKKKADKKTDKKADKKAEAEDIESLELGTRITNALNDAGIDTVAKLKGYDQDYGEIDGIGAKSVEKIEKVLK
jgi:small subunit ribosomal protein S2